jgi:FkbM family methyltransferase
MKKVIKNFLRNRGYEIRPIDTHQEQIDLVNYNWLRNKNINTILDIGASFGQYATKARKIFPDAHIISFEAIPASFEILKEKLGNNKSHSFHNLALSNYRGETVFRISSNSGSSSLLEMNDVHKTNYPESKDIREITIPCDKLDNVLQNTPLNEKVLMKLDVQGAEKLVLEGAEETLKKVDIIFSEKNFTELYKGNVSFSELSKYLYERGFAVIGIENVSQSPIDGSFLQADAYFERIRK